MASFGYDEDTVADWEERAGTHAEQVHAAIVQQGQVDLQHVQADELWVKLLGCKVWLAMAIAGPSRLWLGAVVSASRDMSLLRRLVAQVRACARHLSILVCVDGLAGYVRAFQEGFRTPLRTGKPGRPRLLPAQGLLIGQVVKQYVHRRVVAAETRVAQGTERAIRAVLRRTRTGKQIHTAYIERLNATFRARLAPLVRRGRALARQQSRLTAQVYWVGCLYNFCTMHTSLRERLGPGQDRKWRERTPAMAAGLTDHQWRVLELLQYRVPLSPWTPPRPAGRRPRRTHLSRGVSPSPEGAVM